MAQFPAVGVQAVVEGIGGFLRDMGKMDSAIGKTADKADGGGSRIGKLGGKLAGAGKAAAAAAVTGVAALGAAVVGIGVVSLKTAVEFESAWAGVVKTTDGLVDEFGNLTEAGTEMQDEFRDLAKVVPVAVEELLEIGELGGQLGVAGEDLIGFTEVIAAMGVSTNLSTEEAGTGLARLANVMGTVEAEGSAAFSKLGSTVVALGNNSATTEADILNFAQRMAGAAEVAGVTEADMLGISAAFSSVGIQAQAGGTAVSKTFLKMNKAAIEGGEEMEIFAAVAGLGAEEFGAAWEQDAGAVFGEFVKGLGMAGDDAVGILDALEIKDSQAVRAFLSLAGAGDLVTKSIDIANDGWESNTALATEAETRYKTTESQMVLLKNTLKDVGITIGMALLPWLNKLLEAARPLIDEFGKRLPGFLNDVLTPALEKLISFLAEYLPQAFEITRSIIVGVYIPALQAVWNFISTSLVPVLQSLWDWLAVMLPQALATATEFWNNVLLPALQTVSEFVQTTLIPAFMQFVEFLSAVVTVVVQEVSSFIVEMFEVVKAWVDENWPLIQETIQTVMTAIQTVIQTVLGAISAFWTEHGTAIMNAVQVAWDVIKTVIETTIRTVLEIIKAVMQAINGDWDAAWTTIKDQAEVVWGLIQTAIETAINFIKDTILPAAMTAIQALWETGWNLVKTAAETIWAEIQTLIDTAITAAKTKVMEVLDSLGIEWRDNWEDIQRNVEVVWKAIQTAVDVAMTAISTLVSTVTGTIQTVFGETMDWLLTKTEEIWPAVETAFQTGIDAAKAVLDNMLPAMQEAGAALIDAIKEGVMSAMGGLQDAVNSGLDSLTDLLPWSEPKDPSSPLRGLGRAGAAIVDNITAGLADAMPTLQAQLNAAIAPSQGPGPASSISNTSTVNNITNIEVISNPPSQPSEQAIALDLSAALAAARGG